MYRYRKDGISVLAVVDRRRMKNNGLSANADLFFCFVVTELKMPEYTPEQLFLTIMLNKVRHLCTR